MYETSGFRWVRRIGLLVLAAFVTFPLYATVVGSLSTTSAGSAGFHWLPRHMSLRSFRDVWSTIPLTRYLVNSAIVASCSAILAVAVALPAAYALARHRFRGDRLLLAALLATQFVPGLVFLIPLFLTYSEVQRLSGVQLIGNYTGLVLTDLTFAVPFAVWLLAGYLSTLSADTEDAARIDGSGTLALLTRIVIPTAAPGLAAVTLLAFGLSWGEVLFASVLTVDRTATAPVGLPSLVTGSDAFWNQLLAASIITSIPILVTFLGLRRFLIRGRHVTPVE